MNIILDLIVIAIIVAFVIISAKRGFVRVAVEVAGFIAAVMISLSLSTTLADFTYNKAIEPSIISSVGEVAENTTADTAENVWEALPDFIKNNAERFGINKEEITRNISSGMGQNTTEIVTDISQNSIKPVAVGILKALYEVILMLVLLVIVKFLARFINKLFSFSLVGKLNKVLGGTLGLVKGLIIAWIFCTAVVLIISFTENGIWIFNSENIEKTYIFKMLANLIKF